MFKITNETKNKEGYILIDKIFIAHPSENGFETRLAQIELYGKAIKTSIYDKSFSTIVEVIDYFADDHITVSILQYPSTDNDLYIYEFNKTIIVSNQEQMSSLREYASLVMANPDIFDYSSTDSSDINSLSGIEFENLCKNLLEKMNFEVSTTKQSGDGGIDLIAYNHQPMLEGKYIVQCKRYSGSVGEPIIRDLYGVVNSERANKGILITTGTFTKSAVEFSIGKQLELIDGEKLNQLLNSYSISFDCDTKSSNTSLSALLLRFDKELGVRYFSTEKTLNQIDYLKTNPNNSRMRAAVLVQLLLPFGDLGDISDQYLKLISDEYHYQLNMYEKYLNKSNLAEQRLLFLFKSQSIQLRIMSGELFEAINEYFDLASKQLPINDLSINDAEEFILILYNISYNIIQIALIIDEPSLAHNVQIRAASWITTACDYYKRYDTDTHKREYLRTQHLLEMDSFMILLPDGVKDYYGIVYEQGYDTFWFTFVPHKINIKDDTLTIQDVKTINNISEKVAKAKSLI